MSAQAEVTKDNEAEVVVALTPEQLAEKEAKQIEADEKELVELSKAVSSGKSVDYVRLAKLSAEKGQRDAIKEEAEKGNKLWAFVSETLKLDAKQAIALLRPHVPAGTTATPSNTNNNGLEVLVRYTDKDGATHERIEGERATPKWAKSMKDNISYSEALKSIVATTSTGKMKAETFIKKLYGR